jgi:Flp pilus assembly protein TadD
MATTDDDFLADEFVLDDVPDNGREPTVIFAGPSDAPPVMPAAPAPGPATAPGWRPYVLVATAVLSAAAAVGATLGARRTTPGRDAISVARGSQAGDPAAEGSAATLAPSGGTTSAGSVPGATASASPSASGEADAEDPAVQQATRAKQEAESALEKGHATLAIEAAQRAVDLDPSDAEAWLILGAGYDQQKAYAQARKCFATCARVATRGPRRECAALLR